MAWNRLFWIRAILIAFSFFSFVSSHAKEEWLLVYLKDKGNQSLTNAHTSFSVQAHVRRHLQGVAYDSLDLPVFAPYLEELEKSGVSPYQTSRWLNAVLIQSTEDSTILSTIRSLPFVSHVNYLAGKGSVQGMSSHSNTNQTNKGWYKDYSKISQHLNLMGINALHDQGLFGDGVPIAVIDAGFPGVDTLQHFRHLYRKSKFIGQYDYRFEATNVYTGMGHGTMVLSVMAGQYNILMEPVAPNARYCLIASEDEYAEYPFEEFMLVKALEHADSVGVWISNVSLGYHTFDDKQFNYQPSQLNGQTSISTLATDIASRKGMLVVSSAGNEGNQPWKYISFPADAKDVLSVGAIDLKGRPAKFASYAAPASKFMNPKVAAFGVKIPVVTSNGQIVWSNGSSFSSPLVAATAACLWQSFPKATSKEIAESLIISASNHPMQDPQKGSGIPNVSKARELLLKAESLESFVAVVPDYNNYVMLFAKDSGDLMVENQQGTVVFSKKIELKAPQLLLMSEPIWDELASGSYKIVWKEKSAQATADWEIK